MGGANGGVQIACKSCYECSENIKEPCCGCVNLRKSHGDGGRSAIVGDDDFAPDHFLVKKDFDGNLVERDLSSSSRKKTEICSEQVRTETYTSFPNLNRPNEPWIGVIPSQILAYYHNTSSSCSDWGIRRFNSHDVDTTGVRVHYESMLSLFTT